MVTLAAMAMALLVAGSAGAAMAWTLVGRRVRLLRGSLAACQRALAHARTEQADRHAVYRIMAEHASDVIVRLDAGCRPVYVSPSCREVFGYAPEDLLDRAAFALIHPVNLPGDLDTLDGGAATPASGPIRDATWQTRHKDGSRVWIEARYRRIAEDGGVVAVLRDISPRMRAEEHLSEARDRLKRLAMNDSLTGLPNRGCFLEAAERLLRGRETLAVLFIDLDRFKPMNDVHGHAVGDAILREVGARLARTLVHEPMVARLGGDEFAALLRVTDDDAGIATRARDIIHAVAEPIRIGEMTLDVGATIGISVSPRDGTDAVAMLRTADIAMAHAKAAGGGCYRFFERPMAEALELAAELKRELREALAAGEIVPYFQPLVRMDDTTVIGFEVLARWEHPGRGTLPPAEFLPLVEEMGLSAEMFAALLTHACATARDWPAQVKLSMNISPHELQDESLPETVRRILLRTGFDGSRLEIEITENALIHDSRVARGVLDGLRALGVSVVLDDFGTGFSSLYHLRELPFDKVKIDKSFMAALASDAESARYVAAIVGLGHALGLELTAEGIEDVPTMLRLRELGCTYGQGYLFGRAVPSDQAGRILTANDLASLAAE